MKVSYQWLKEYFEEGAQLPTPEEIEQKLSFYAFEIEEVVEDKERNDFVIDVDVLPNRAHDCLSHEGIAKEISVLFDIPLKREANRETAFENESKLTVQVLQGQPEHCRRYCGCRIEGIKIEDSPQWLKDRLEVLGQRSINNVVDITNYVMLSIGQPMHAFDADKVSDDTIVVRHAVKSDTLTTLDGKEVELQSPDLVICDAQKALALAGVKGGKAAEVDENTTSIILEAANFDPGMTRKTARRTKILTDSSKRFENEPTAELVSRAMDMAISMVVQISGNDSTKVFQKVDEYPVKAQQQNIVIPHSYIERVTGMTLEPRMVTDIFEKFQWGYKSEGGLYTVVPSIERVDLKNKEDLIEDIARVYGYNNIPTAQNLDDIPYAAQFNKRFYVESKIKNILVSQDFWEVESYTLVEKGELEVIAPLAQDKKAIRTTTVPQIVKALEVNARNAQLLGLNEIKIFETSMVFNGGEERLVLTIAIDPLAKKARNKGTGERISAVAQRLFDELGIEGSPSDFVVNKEGLAVEFDLSKIIELASNPIDETDYKKVMEIPRGSQYVVSQDFSKFPYITRDMAVWIDIQNDSPDELQKLLKESAGDLLMREPYLVDMYEKAETGKTSYAFRMIFQAMDRTLTDEELSPVMKNLEQVVADRGWGVR